MPFVLNHRTNLVVSICFRFICAGLGFNREIKNSWTNDWYDFQYFTIKSSLLNLINMSSRSLFSSYFSICISHITFTLTYIGVVTTRISRFSCGFSCRYISTGTPEDFAAAYVSQTKFPADSNAAGISAGKPSFCWGFSCWIIFQCYFYASLGNSAGISGDFSAIFQLFFPADFPAVCLFCWNFEFLNIEYWSYNLNIKSKSTYIQIKCQSN